MTTRKNKAETTGSVQHDHNDFRKKGVSKLPYEEIDLSKLSLALHRKWQKLENDKTRAYAERDLCVAVLCRMVLDLGWKAGLKEHQGENWDKEWRTVVIFDLPSGQCSYHIHENEKPWFDFLGEYDGEWDGHDTPTKIQRMLKGWPRNPDKS